MDRTLLVLFVALLALSACTQSRGRGGGRVEGMNPGECSDGADNDGDRSFDCNDPDCFGAPVCADGATPRDAAPGDSRITTPDAGPDATPRDASTDTMPTTDTSVPTMCVDASGTWESIAVCDLIPEGELATVSRTGACTFSFTSGIANGTGTVDEMNGVTIDLTSPIEATCIGSIDGELMVIDCLGCLLELFRL